MENVLKKLDKLDPKGGSQRQQDGPERAYPPDQRNQNAERHQHNQVSAQVVKNGSHISGRHPVLEHLDLPEKGEETRLVEFICEILPRKGEMTRENGEKGEGGNRADVNGEYSAEQGAGKFHPLEAEKPQKDKNSEGDQHSVRNGDEDLRCGKGAGERGELIHWTVPPSGHLPGMG